MKHYKTNSLLSESLNAIHEYEKKPLKESKKPLKESYYFVDTQTRDKFGPYETIGQAMGKIKQYLGPYYDSHSKYMVIMDDAGKVYKASGEPTEESLKESFNNWTDAYNLFTACADRFFPDEEKIAQAAQQVYEIFKGDPQVEEAWKRWNDTDSVKEYEETDESLTEDTVKQKDNKWVNKGKKGTHGEFKTKKEADDQRKAMFARGYKG